MRHPFSSKFLYALLGAFLLFSGAAHAQVGPGAVTIRPPFVAGDCVQAVAGGGITTGSNGACGGSGTVTSVDVSGGTTGLTTSGGPITSSGTITLGGDLVVSNGGTGAATFTTNGVLFGNTTSAFGVTAAGTNGTYLKGNTGSAPTFGTLSSDAVTTLSFGSTGLTPNSATSGAITVAGTLAVGSGGTGQTTYTDGQLLIGNTSGNTLSKATLTAGTNVTITNGHGTITIAASGGGGSGCTTSGSGGQILSDNGSGGCSSNADLTFATGTITSGVNTSEGGALKMFGSTSGNLTVKPAAAAGTNTVLTLPGGTTDFSATGGTSQVVKQTSSGGAFTVAQLACADLSNAGTSCTVNTGTSGATIPLLNGNNTWSGTQSFNDGDLILKGSSSGTLTMHAAATAGSGVLTWPAGTTDFSATGGTSQVLKQTSSGGAFTVARLACADLSDSGTACTAATGTSGATLPFLNGANTWSGVQTFTNSDIALLGSSTGKTTFTSANSGASNFTLTFPAVTDTLAALGTAQTWTAKQTFNGSTTVAAAALVNAVEPATISATAATGTINYDVTTQSILYYTTNASANWTLNLRANSGHSLDSIMSTGDIITVTFMVTQGGTPFYNNALQVDGNSVSPKCQGGTCPAAGNASGIDVYTYAIIKTGSATFTVLESQTQYK